METGATDCVFYLPGEKLPISLDETVVPCTSSSRNQGKSGKFVIGPGLKVQDSNVIATRAGVWQTQKDKRVYWIDSSGKRYVPIKGDRVLGVVTNRLTDGWRVDIGSAEPAFVSSLSFEGSTKKNRPNVKVGDLLYAQLMIAMKDMEPELVCVDSEYKARGMGLLPVGGMLYNLPLRTCRRLLDTKECPLLNLLGKELKFEVTVGLNGRVWVKSHSHKQTVLIGLGLKQLESVVTLEEVKSLAEKIIYDIKGI